MWISFQHVSDLFSVAKDSVAALKEENAALKAENAAIKSDLLSAKVNLDWLRVQYNQVQAERTALVNKQLNIAVPTPQLVAPQVGAYLPSVAAQNELLRQMPHLQDLSFEDMGDELASKFGLPTYDR